jgi:hypothetical protein
MANLNSHPIDSIRAHATSGWRVRGLSVNRYHEEKKMGTHLVGGSTNERIKNQIRAFGTRSIWYVLEGEAHRGGTFDFGTVKELRATLRILRAVANGELSTSQERRLPEAELAYWQTQPARMVAYQSNNAGQLTTWLGTPIGRVIRSSTFRNRLTGSRMTALRVRGSNGATYFGRYGSDWSQAVILRKSKSAR